MFAGIFQCCLCIMGDSSSTETTIISNNQSPYQMPPGPPPGQYQMPPGPPPGQFAGQLPAYGYNVASENVYAAPQPQHIDMAGKYAG